MNRYELAAVCALVVLAGCGSQQEGAAARSSTESLPAHLEYGCGAGGTFTAQDVAAQRQPSQDVLTALDRLRQNTDGAFLPSSGWSVVSQEEHVATLLAPLRDAFASASFEKEGGSWEPVQWGGCVPRLDLEGKSVLRWAFTNESYPPEPDATKLSLLVGEVQCSGGRDIDGLIESLVTYRESTLEVVLTAPEPPGGTDQAHTCIGTMPVEYTLVLEEAVGKREVLDLSVYPGVEPTQGTSIP